MQELGRQQLQLSFTFTLLSILAWIGGIISAPQNFGFASVGYCFPII
jgi:hypothetical protein